MTLGAAVGVVVILAVANHAGLAGVPWLVNVALAKLGLVSAAGLLGGGATAVRVARRRAVRHVGAGPAG
jgi:hypothetical protein